MVFKGVSFAQQGCIYLIKNTVKIIIIVKYYYNFKYLLSIWIYFIINVLL